jgi:hypothetical protein
MFLTEIKNVGKPDVDIDVKYSEQDRTAVREFQMGNFQKY